MEHSPISQLKIVALAGGVGGAKLADGLMQALPPENLTVVVNTGDDFEYLGLNICPDLDSVVYTLAGIANPATGWGRSGETWQALESLGELGGPTWFRLGDRDLGLHLERTRRLKAGLSLSQFTRHLCQVWKVQVNVLPMSDDPIPTWVYTEIGELSFQEYFVRRQCTPSVTGFCFRGVSEARPASGVLEKLEAADMIIFCPSNPWVSLDPILAVPGVQALIEQRIARAEVQVVAVSPIIGGATVKGPAAKMFSELGIIPSALSVARHYGTLLTGFVLDRLDADLAGPVAAMKISPLVTGTIMKSPDDRKRLAQEVLTFGAGLLAA